MVSLTFRVWQEGGGGEDQFKAVWKGPGLTV